jgi:hypothetical protein
MRPLAYGGIFSEECSISVIKVALCREFQYTGYTKPCEALMSKISDQVALAKARAAEVVGGFKRVREQSARDVLALAAIIEAQGRAMVELQQRLDMQSALVHDAELRASHRPRPGATDDPAFAEIFNGIFGQSAGFGAKR